MPAHAVRSTTAKMVPPAFGAKMHDTIPMANSRTYASPINPKNQLLLLNLADDVGREGQARLGGLDPLVGVLLQGLYKNLHCASHSSC